ncbi:MAG TPA: hypothetical protein PLA65_20680, partial [Spirochaetota bacterium]|nr:hypothetical protein [Spirochaetota bacterium]
MNWIRTIIKPRYSSIVPLLILHGSIIILMNILYRVRVYSLVTEIYPDLKLNGIYEFLSLSLHHDSILIVSAILLVLCIALVFAGARRALHVILASFSVLFIFFILFSMDFFRVYQTAFQSNFAGREHFSGLGNVLDSAMAEFSGEFYLMFFLFSAISAASHAFLYYRERISNRLRMKRSGLLTTRLAALTVPVLVLVFLLLSASTDASIERNRFAGRYRADQISRNISLLHEFTANPILNLFGSGAASPVNQDSPGTSPSTEFRFRLDTASLETVKRHERIGSIPRNKRYNIILYFFESTPRKYYDMKINGRYVVETWHRLEKNSINFLNHYANYPLSANALMSVLTSAYDL